MAPLFPPMFFFGTLMDRDVRQAVLGRPTPEHALEPASLRGWCRRPVAGRTYPMLAPHPAGQVDGVLVHGLDAHDRRRLDHYEGEEYIVAEMKVISGRGGRRNALVYVCRPGVAAGRGPWRLRDWQSRHKRAALARIRAVMAACPPNQSASASS